MCHTEHEYQAAQQRRTGVCRYCRWPWQVLGAGTRYQRLAHRAGHLWPHHQRFNNNDLPDAFEQENGVSSPDTDPDLDGLDNLSEYQLGTDPNDSDTDDGGENDGSEFNLGQDPFNPDDDQIEPPAFLSVQANVGANLITYGTQTGYNRLVLWRSTAANGPWIVRNQQLDMSGVYSDTADNNTTYYYKLMGVDANDHRSAIINSAQATPRLIPLPQKRAC